MNTMRSLLLSAAIALTGIASCNYTVGECWPVGQGGGSGTESVAAGGGVILPTGPSGAGGSGDQPPKEPQTTDPEPEIKCNSDEEEEEADKENHGDGSAEPHAKDPQVKCAVPGSSACVAQCDAIGAYCVHHAEHPYKPPAIGDLYWCKGGKPTWTCSYK